LSGNIDFTDSLYKIYIGTDFLGKHVADARIDNLRFANVMRQVLFVNGVATDPNYAPPATATRMVEDIYTTYLQDFESDGSKFEFFSRLINSISGIYDYDVDVIDSFDKVIGVQNGQLEDLMQALLQALRPAHTRLVTKFTE